MEIPARVGIAATLDETAVAPRPRVVRRTLAAQERLGSGAELAHGEECERPSLAEPVHA